MDKIAFKCITCGRVTYMPGCDENTPGVEIREATQCLQCLRDTPVSQRPRDRILAKYACGEC